MWVGDGRNGWSFFSLNKLNKTYIAVKIIPSADMLGREEENRDYAMRN